MLPGPRPLPGDGGLPCPVVQPAREYGAGLAVVVVGRGGAPTVARCLASLGGPARVLVTVGGPGAEAVPGVDVLDLGEDLPRPAAVNRAVAGLDHEAGLVLVTEPQVTWGAGALDALLAAARRRPRAAVLAPCCAGPSPAVLPGRWAGDVLLRALTPALAVTPRPVAGGDTGGEAGEVVDAVPGHAVLLRRGALDSVAGYDAALPAAVADLDLADRLRRAGWLVVRVPAASATHPGGSDGPETGPERHRAARRYLVRRHRGARGVALGVALAARSRAVGA